MRIVATGCPTEAGRRALHPLIHRARSPTPGIHVTVDLRGAHHVEPAGVDLLRRSAALDPPAAQRGDVDLAPPDPSPGARGPAAPRTTPAADPRGTGTRARNAVLRDGRATTAGLLSEHRR